MRKITILSSLIFYTIIQAQTSPPPVIKNPLTTFGGLKVNSRKGTLIEKKTIDVAKFKNLNIQKIITKDLSDNTTENVLGIMSETETYDNISKRTLTIEKPELSKLIQALQTIEVKQSETKNNQGSKYKFETFSNIEFGSVYKENSKNWINYIQLPMNFANQNFTEFNNVELNELIKVLKTVEQEL
ncbi:hypothetical protein B0A69_02955 [Chryseobacterium shigense]|uniref:Uncharacterized protein n=1 Tax=Chryseobacterium shigense TaxID=297244 RepID=A0A1N7I843_9FLAO|nr:hypothetical protein [Chryseobacterium shigense]PQA97023.1 hypothetical protein B0A69_02955 [Chryseobacterium shigense]SIS33180.1 hypothetical protein SAMN05421639_102540 [Chryseobacterium shigense]